MRPLESFVAQPVRSLQTMLRVIGEDAGYNENVIPDGIYGSSTIDAVRRFQQQHSLQSTGITDQATWEAIVAEYTDSLVRVDRAQPLQLILNPGQIIGQGESHPYIYLVQSMLLSLSQIYGSITSPRLTGVVDLSTMESIASFQYLSGLPQTGAVDKITWKHLALQYPLAVNKLKTANRIHR